MWIHARMIIQQKLMGGKSRRQEIMSPEPSAVIQTQVHIDLFTMFFHNPSLSYCSSLYCSSCLACPGTRVDSCSKQLSASSRGLLVINNTTWQLEYYTIGPSCLCPVDTKRTDHVIWHPSIVKSTSKGGLTLRIHQHLFNPGANTSCF